MGDTPIPVDLVTCSGSGLDPHISVAAAEYQIPRLAKANNKTEEEIRAIIDKCKNGRFIGRNRKCFKSKSYVRRHFKRIILFEHYKYIKGFFH